MILHFYQAAARAKLLRKELRFLFNVGQPRDF